MIRPNYTVRSLVPYHTKEDESVSGDSFLKKADSLMNDCYQSRRRTYQFLFLAFSVFSVLGLYYYTYAAEGLIPVSMYTPATNSETVNFITVFLFRRIHIFASLFLMLSGFSVFGSPVSLLFIGTDAFIIGFSVRYSLSFLQTNSSFIFILLYFFCIALFAIVDILLCCEVMKYSKYARGGTKEMLRTKRLFGYLFYFILVSCFNFLASYIFMIV